MNLTLWLSKNQFKNKIKRFAMKKYEVWLADLDPSFGTEAGKQRPVIIVQSNRMNGKHASTIVCPITTRLKPHYKLTRIHLLSGDAGLTYDSDIMVDQIRAIDNKRFIKKMGTITTSHQVDLENSLKDVLDLT
jgi:mRNA interferase MazF